jgi:hypothetical protein
MRIQLTWLVLLPLLACGAEKEEDKSCLNEEQARDLVPTDASPDWQRELEYSAAELGLERQSGPSSSTESVPALRERIEVWDCLDLSWWSPAGHRKVVQIWADETECSYFERASVEYYPCDSHAGQDDHYRDRDQDGYYKSEGDCDDRDDNAFPDAPEQCDGVDNNCDGRVDEKKSCD